MDENDLEEEIKGFYREMNNLSEIFALRVENWGKPFEEISSSEGRGSKSAIDYLIDAYKVAIGLRVLCSLYSKQNCGSNRFEKIMRKAEHVIELGDYAIDEMKTRIVELAAINLKKG